MQQGLVSRQSSERLESCESDLVGVTLLAVTRDSQASRLGL